MSSKNLRAITKPRTKAGRRLLRWIDANATDDRMIYAVVKNGPTVGDLRAAILAIEEEVAPSPLGDKP